MKEVFLRGEPASFNGTFAEKAFIYHCPVDECGWQFGVSSGEMAATPMTLADIFGVGTMQAVAAYKQAQVTEDAIHNHMREHSSLDFLQTIMRLKKKVGEA